MIFLETNNPLYKDGKERINNDALATLTILIATSKPENKDNMMQLIRTIMKQKNTYHNIMFGGGID